MTPFRPIAARRPERSWLRLELFVVLVGAVVLAGWLLDVQTLKSISPGWSSMKANTAICFVLAGTALWLLRAADAGRRRRAAGRALASFVAVVGLLTLAEYVFGWSLGIDQLLFRDSSTAVGAADPGRMAATTALALVLSAAALLLLDAEIGRFRPANVASLATAGIALLAVAGYLYDVPTLRSGFTSVVKPMALHTSLTLLAFAAAVLLSRPRAGLMALVASGGAGGTMIRRLLLPIFALPLVVGWLRLEGQRQGLYGTEFGLAILVVALIVLMSVVVWIAGRPLERKDAEQRRAEAEIRALNEELEARVRERTARLEEVNRELEAFTYSASHDLRAPLRAIDGFARLLTEEHGQGLGGEARRYLGVIRESAQGMGKLIDGLLALSQLGRQTLALHRVDTGTLVREALAQLEAERGARRIELSVGELPAVRADPMLLRQVFVNLLANALKFTRERDPAHIEVGAYAEDGEHVVFVRDNGAGFDMRYADKLFGVFERLHRPDEYEGTGLGLALVQRVVQRHGGRVWAEGAPDEGATFFFTLKGDNSDD